MIVEYEIWFSCVLYSGNSMDNQDIAWRFGCSTFVRLFLSLRFTLFDLDFFIPLWFRGDRDEESDSIQDWNVILCDAGHPAPDFEHGIATAGHESRW